MSHHANNHSSVLFRCAGVPLVLGLLLGALAAGSAVSGEPDTAYDDFGDVVCTATVRIPFSASRES